MSPSPLITPDTPGPTLGPTYFTAFGVDENGSEYFTLRIRDLAGGRDLEDEIGVRLLRSLVRTTKLCLESMIGVQIPIQHALVPWLLQRTALLLNGQRRLADGQAPWSRVRGRAFAQQIVCLNIANKVKIFGVFH